MMAINLSNNDQPIANTNHQSNQIDHQLERKRYKKQVFQISGNWQKNSNISYVTSCSIDKLTFSQNNC